MSSGGKKLRVGLIGTGIIASEAHVPALLRLEDRFEITAICNHTEPKAAALAGKIGLPRERIWLDWERMLTEAPLDAVIVCLPIELNYPVSEAAARAGKHVLCEKPIGRSVEEIKAAVSLGSRHGVTFMVAEDCHYTPSFMKAAEMLRDGAVGEIISILWSQMRFLSPDNKYAKTAWRINHAYPGGYLLDGGVHNVHVLQMLAGPVESVKAEVRSTEKYLGALDRAFCLLNHENGVLSSLNLCWHARDSGEVPLKVFGSRGTLIVEDERIVRIDPAGISQEIGVGNEDSFYLEQLDFYRAVTKNETPSCTPESTAHDAAVILALLEAAGDSSAVRVGKIGGNERAE